MNLKLEKPLAFLDLETTGVNVSKDKIVEIAIIKINPDSSKEEYNKRINPEIPIPIETSEIHGIYDFDVINSPNFKAVSIEIEDFIKGCDLGGFNSNKFDIPLLVEEFYRCNIDIKIEERKLIDVQNIFHKMEQRTLVAAYRFYCNKDLTNAHSALADTAATLDVFMAQLEKYESLENNIDFLHDFSIQGLKFPMFSKVNLAITPGFNLGTSPQILSCASRKFGMNLKIKRHENNLYWKKLYRSCKRIK